MADQNIPVWTIISRRIHQLIFMVDSTQIICDVFTMVGLLIASHKTAE
ncbi:hypothetical protein M5Y49_24520 [Escherichia coli]|nr:hypothetical protein [Escherichia coli]